MGASAGGGEGGGLWQREEWGGAEVEGKAGGIEGVGADHTRLFL